MSRISSGLASAASVSVWFTLEGLEFSRYQERLGFNRCNIYIYVIYLNLYVFMWRYIYIMYMCVHVYMYTYVIYAYTHSVYLCYECIYICIYMYIYILCIVLYMSVCRYIYIYMYTYRYTYTHYTHTYKIKGGVCQIKWRVAEYTTPKYTSLAYGLFWAKGNWQEVATRKAYCRPAICLKAGQNFTKESFFPSLPQRQKLITGDIFGSLSMEKAD